MYTRVGPHPDDGSVMYMRMGQYAVVIFCLLLWSASGVVRSALLMLVVFLTIGKMASIAYGSIGVTGTACYIYRGYGDRGSESAAVRRFTPEPCSRPLSSMRNLNDFSRQGRPT